MYARVITPFDIVACMLLRWLLAIFGRLILFLLSPFGVIPLMVLGVFLENWVLQLNRRILAIEDAVQVNCGVDCDRYRVGIIWIDAGCEDLC